MYEIYAALLLHEAKQPITLENLNKVLEAVGIKTEEGKLKALIASLEGKDIDKLIKEAEVVSTPVKEEKKEEEVKEEKKEEEAAAGLSLLFG